MRAAFGRLFIFVYTFRNDDTVARTKLVRRRGLGMQNCSPLDAVGWSIIVNRHARRSERARYRQEAGNVLTTYLVDPDQPLDLPILRNAARSWLDALPRRMRSCIVCSGLMWERQRVGWLLLSVPVGPKPPAASVCGICCESADLPLSALERAATVELQAAVPGGRFDPQDTP